MLQDGVAPLDLVAAATRVPPILNVTRQGEMKGHRLADSDAAVKETCETLGKAFFTLLGGYFLKM